MAELNSRQLSEIEQAILIGNKLEAIRLYRQAMNCDLAEAKRGIAEIYSTLKQQRSQDFHSKPTSSATPKPFNSAKKSGLIAFVIIDLFIFAGAAWWFFSDFDSKPLKSSSSNRTTEFQHKQVAESAEQPIRQKAKSLVSSSQSTPKVVSLPTSVPRSRYKTEINENINFVEAYQQKIDNPDYIARKGSRKSMTTDELADEVHIKTVRSQLTAQRTLPQDTPAIPIMVDNSQPVLDGIIDEVEWSVSTSIEIDPKTKTTIYTKSDGEWLFVACDVPKEKTKTGYDQFRFYLHAGMIPELVNERVHIGRGPKITSIRQTTLRWQGASPDNDDERWKKYAINDWGIYKYAVGTSYLSEHRQYELAIHMGEAGIHRGIPFTVFAEVETDPLNNEQGKFKKRQYLGKFANQEAPVWMVIP